MASNTTSLLTTPQSISLLLSSSLNSLPTSHHFLKLNLCKTELIIVPIPFFHAPFPNFTTDISCITSLSLHTILCVILDLDSLISAQHLISFQLLLPSFLLLIYSLVTSNLDYCSFLLVWLPTPSLVCQIRSIHLTNRLVSPHPNSSTDFHLPKE